MEDTPFFNFEILDAPEMIDIGQRLIMQGGELLDDTDLEPGERAKVEKVLSQCWDGFQEIKIQKDLLLKISKSKTLSQTERLFKEFIFHAVKILDLLPKMLGILMNSKFSSGSYIKNYKEILSALEHSEEKNIQSLANTIREKNGTLEFLSGLYEGARKEDIIRLCDGPLNKGHSTKLMKLPDGSVLEEVLYKVWSQLIYYIEDFMAYAIALRFLEFIEGLEVISKEEQDPIYPRKFRSKIRKVLDENGETEPLP